MVDMTRIAEAVHARDTPAFEASARAAPIETLLALDHAMRLHRSRKVSENLSWLLQRDSGLRAELGWFQTEADLRLLREAYQSGELCLVLGAGVSQAAGMTGWKELILQLIQHALTHDQPETLLRREKLFREVGHSLGKADRAEELLANERAAIVPLEERQRDELRTVATRLARNQSPSARELLRVSQLLSAHFGSQFPSHLQAALYRRVPEVSALHVAIARFVDVPDSSPQLRAILTYNFDDLVERAISAAGRGYVIHCSIRGRDSQHKEFDAERRCSVDIFHPHGFVPISRGIDISGMDVVLSEQHYYELYGGNPKFTTAIQELVYGRSRVLILGSSLTDPYMRGQLRRAHRQQPGMFHYAALKVPDDVGQPLPESAEELSDRDYSPLMRQTADDCRMLGIRVIWCRTYGQLPRLLSVIRGPFDVLGK